jgi:hypothetical protein
MGEGAESRPYNGMPAGELRGACWWKSGRSSAQGNCIETAKLPGHEVAVRNSRYPQGPTLRLRHLRSGQGPTPSASGFLQDLVEEVHGLVGRCGAHADAVHDMQVLVDVVAPVEVQGIGQVLDIDHIG